MLRAFANIIDRRHNEVIVCFKSSNAIHSSGDFNLCEEGCLSYPDKFIENQNKIYVGRSEDKGQRT